jgi:hypothetical protein
VSAVVLRVVAAEPDLDELARRANEQHRLHVRAAESALEHARLAGEAVIRAREACHRTFIRWIAANCTFKKSTAYNYIAVAEAHAAGKLPATGTLAGALAELAITKVIPPSPDNLDDDHLTVNERQILLFPQAELPLSPRDQAQARDLMIRQDRGADYRCPCCATTWSGDPWPRLRGKFAEIRKPKVPNRENPGHP